MPRNPPNAPVVRIEASAPMVATWVDNLRGSERLMEEMQALAFGDEPGSGIEDSVEKRRFLVFLADLMEAKLPAGTDLKSLPVVPYQCRRKGCRVVIDNEHERAYSEAEYGALLCLDHRQENWLARKRAAEHARQQAALHEARSREEARVRETPTTPEVPSP